MQPQHETFTLPGHKFLHLGFQRVCGVFSVTRFPVWLFCYVEIIGLGRLFPFWHFALQVDPKLYKIAPSNTDYTAAMQPIWPNTDFLVKHDRFFLIVGNNNYVINNYLKAFFSDQNWDLASTVLWSSLQTFGFMKYILQAPYWHYLFLNPLEDVSCWYMLCHDSHLILYT